MRAIKIAQAGWGLQGFISVCAKKAWVGGVGGVGSCWDNCDGWDDWDDWDG